MTAPLGADVWFARRRWLVVLRCGHERIFTVVCPQRGDVVWCASCDAGAVVRSAQVHGRPPREVA